MNKINPSYFLVLVITVFLILLLQLSKKTSEVEDSNKNILKVSKTVEEYKNLKSKWLNKKEIENKLESIVTSFKNDRIFKTVEKNLVIIKLESLNSSSLTRFLNKILNDSFLIDDLEITKTTISIKIRLK